MITLEELIARQRFMLNRSTKASKITDDAQRPNAATANQWAEFEKATAEATQELAGGLERISGQTFPMLRDAQKDMLAAATDLEGRKFEPCAGHDRDALTNLVKARNTVRMALSKPQPSSSEQEMRNFDRTQAQKLRRPKEKDEKREAERLPERIRQLAKQEEFVYAAAAKPPEEPNETSKSKAKSSGSSSSESPADAPSEKKDLKKTQSEVVEEAKSVEETMRRLAGQKDGRPMSQLAQSRMGEAVTKAEQTASALDRGDRSDAARKAKETAGMFKELAVHTEGLLGREAAQRLAAARDLASNLAQRERDLADRLDQTAPPSVKPGAMASSNSEKSDSQNKSPSGKSGREFAKSSQTAKGKSSSQKGEASSAETEDSLAAGGSRRIGQDAQDEAARLTESGRTLEDLLRALAPGDEAKHLRPEALDRIEKLLREADAAALPGQMRHVEELLRSGRAASGREEAKQLAERLDGLAQRLDVLHRAVVTPQLESLIALEKRAAELRESLKRLDSQAAISEWHRQADLLLQQLGRLKARSREADRLTEAMRAQGWGSNVTRWDWSRNGGYYAGPTAYDMPLGAIETELREAVREFVLRELVAAGDEPTPPQYKELVERYFQVLSQRGSSRNGGKAPE